MSKLILLIPVTLLAACQTDNTGSGAANVDTGTSAVAAVDAPVEQTIQNYGVGSSWTFRRNVDGDVSNFTTTLTEKREIDGRLIDVISHSVPLSNPNFPCDGENGALFDAATGSWVACTKNGEILAGSIPHGGGYAWPMKVGNNWRTDYRWTDNVVRPDWNGSGWAKRAILAYEEVTVPAGTLMAYKVSTTDTSSRDWGSVVWYSPEVKATVKAIDRRTGSNGYGPVTITSELVAVDLK